MARVARDSNWGHHDRFVYPRHRLAAYSTRQLENPAPCGISAPEMARPGLEPGTPRFSAVSASGANVDAVQRERERTSPGRMSELSRAFRAVTGHSGTGSRTCARIAPADREQPEASARHCRQAPSRLADASSWPAQGDRYVLGVGVRRVRARRADRAFGVRCRVTSDFVCLASAASSAPAGLRASRSLSLGLDLTAAQGCASPALLAPVAALSVTQPAPRRGARRTP